MARHMYIRYGLFSMSYVHYMPLIEARLNHVFCWVIMWATVISSNGPGLVRIIPLWTTQEENNINKSVSASVTIKMDD